MALPRLIELVLLVSLWAAVANGVNLLPSFVGKADPSCNPGYYYFTPVPNFPGDPGCRDLDECTSISRTPYCNILQECYNTIGSYTCYYPARVFPSRYSRDGLNITKVAHTANTAPKFRFQCKAEYYSYCTPGATCVADDGLLPYGRLWSGGHRFYNLPECRQLQASNCAGVTSYYSQTPSTHAGAQKACRRLNMRLATASFTRIQFTDEASQCLGNALSNPIWIDKSYVAQFSNSPSHFWPVPLRHVQQRSVNGILCLPDLYQYIVNRKVLKLGPHAIYTCHGGRKLYYIASDGGRNFTEAVHACQERAYQLPAGIMKGCMIHFAERLGFSVSAGEGTAWIGVLDTPNTAYATSGYTYFFHVRQRLTICATY
ncbi:uncharacterized protein LOC135819407 [Sycon ciliatum]|uniref:uncharacterized protein LOC135819407 n=1 Tax=Sycon ciliatum TaxID=27933 RepID=UPI0031F617FD